MLKIVEGVKHPPHWEEKLSAPRPCHYGEYWQDRYADVIRKSAVRRIWPKYAYRVLDVGCGDGLFDVWLRRTFCVQIDGIDAYNWPGAEQRLRRFIRGDAAQVLRRVIRPMEYDMAICITSLPFMKDWRACVYELVRIVPRVLIVENLQTPVPPWQKGLPEKEPIAWPDLNIEFLSYGWVARKIQPVNVIDRRLFLKFPWPWARPLVFLATLVGDWVWSYFGSVHTGRYAAVLFQKKSWL